MKKRFDREINLTANGHKGHAGIKWIPENQYGVAHYEAFITVPFQDSRWVHLYIFNKEDINEAFAKAWEHLTGALERCTLV